MSEDWPALEAQAARCLHDGRIEDGIAAFEQLVELRPDHADSWFNLAYLRRCARHYDAALDAYGKALEHQVERPEEVHINRAAILSEHLKRTAEAEIELKAAVARNPAALIAWLNLGNLFEDRGDTAKARDAYLRALKVAPDSGRALARIAAIDVYQGRERRAIAMLRETVRIARPAPADAAEIGFALGSALDAAGEYDEAFAAIDQANRLAASLLPLSARYDRAAHERLVDALIETFPLAAALPGQPEANDPIFICGLFRSGSTLAEQILGRHSRVTAAGELEFIPAMVRERLQPYPHSLAEASPALLASLSDIYRAELDALYPQHDVITDKRPDNFLHIGLIKTLFPRARIVHTVRDPLDTIVSTYFLHFAEGVSYGSDLADIVHWVGQYRRLMDHWRSLYGSDILDLDYDRLVADPRPEVERLLEHCGLEWEDGVLAAGKTAAAVRTASNWQVRGPLHPRSSGRWRTYERQLADVRAALARGGV